MRMTLILLIQFDCWIYSMKMMMGETYSVTLLAAPMKLPLHQQLDDLELGAGFTHYWDGLRLDGASSQWLHRVWCKAHPRQRDVIPEFLEPRSDVCCVLSFAERAVGGSWDSWLLSPPKSVVNLPKDQCCQSLQDCFYSMGKYFQFFDFTHIICLLWF